MAKVNRILVLPGEPLELAKSFKCSPQTVRQALRYQTFGDRPEAIRAEAIRRGGKLTTLTVFSVNQSAARMSRNLKTEGKQ